MDRETFEWIWKRIEPNIDAIENALDSAERMRMHFRRVYEKEKALEVILQEYNTVRNALKADYYKNHEPEDGESNLIDHHKIAACLCQALLQKKIFTFNMDDNISVEMLLSNYKLAYTASLTIIYLCMIDWYIYKCDNVVLAKLLAQKQLLGPGTTTTHAPYHEGRIKTLAQNEHRGINFDILSYADMMYWIEHYNRQLLENKIDVEPYNPEVMSVKSKKMND